LAPQWWHRLILLAFVTYSLAYVDCSNYSHCAALGVFATEPQPADSRRWRLANALIRPHTEGPASG